VDHTTVTNNKVSWYLSEDDMKRDVHLEVSVNLSTISECETIFSESVDAVKRFIANKGLKNATVKVEIRNINRDDGLSTPAVQDRKN
jgi:hypothetical protein